MKYDFPFYLFFFIFYLRKCFFSTLEKENNTSRSRKCFFFFGTLGKENQGKFLGKKFLGVRFIGMTFLGKRFPCYVVLPPLSPHYPSLHLVRIVCEWEFLTIHKCEALVRQNARLPYHIHFNWEGKQSTYENWSTDIGSILLNTYSASVSLSTVTVKTAVLLPLIDLGFLLNENKFIKHC